MYDVEVTCMNISRAVKRIEEVFSKHLMENIKELPKGL